MRSCEWLGLVFDVNTVFGYGDGGYSGFVTDVQPVSDCIGDLGVFIVALWAQLTGPVGVVLPASEATYGEAEGDNNAVFLPGDGCVAQVAAFDFVFH